MTTDRGRAALEKLVALLLPSLAGYVEWEYQVIASTPGPPVKIDCIPNVSSCPFGPLAGLTLWPGPDGGVAVPTIGKLVLVRFNNARRPVVCGLDPTDTPVLVYQYGTIVQAGDATATPLVKAIPYAGLLTAVGALATGVTSFGPACAASTDPVLVTAAGALGSVGAALTSALAALPPPATEKLLGT